MKRRNVGSIIVAVVVILGLAFVAWQWRVLHSPAGFPTKPGSYALDGWRYQYTVTAPWTRSERRTGRLYEGGAEITGSLGEIRETPLGRFAFFGRNGQRYNAGWLNTMTYDRPVFDPDGRVLPDVQPHLSKLDSSNGRP